MLKESIEGLAVQPDGVYVDATYGGGGYSREILKKLHKGKLFSIDLDEEAATNMPVSEKFVFIHGNFRYIRNYLKYYNVEEADGIVADIGVSSHHFDIAGRGFTYRQEAPLDMRMNLSADFTAFNVVNDYDEDDLARIFREYGELNQAGRIAGQIVRSRREKKIETNVDLINCIKNLVRGRNENQFLSQVFQALRIEVNSELENLEAFLNDAGDLLKSGGRLVVVSYHSLEDRLVKNYMRWGNTREEPQKDVYGRWKEKFRLLSKKPLVPAKMEVMMNPRSRSARLRIAEKI